MIIIELDDDERAMWCQRAWGFKEHDDDQKA